MPRKVPDDESRAIAATADEILRETVAAHEAFVATNGRTFPRAQWKHIRTKGTLRVFLSRAQFDVLSAKLQTTKRNGSSSSTRSSNSHRTSGSGGEGGAPPKRMIFALAGALEGTLEDAAFGNIADNEAVWRLRSTYTKDYHHECKIMATLEAPTTADPFRFLGAKWSLKELPAFVALRDMVYLESAGVVRDAQGKITMGYNLMHSIELPGIPMFDQLDVQRLRLSCCFLTKQRDDNMIEIYCRAFCFPTGTRFKRLGMVLYAKALLAALNVTQCAHMKKLMWLSHHQKKAHNDSMESQDVSHRHTCPRRFKRLLPFTKSRAATYRCCGCIMCARCCREQHVIVNLAENSVVQTAMPYCLRCIAQAKTLSALEIAHATCDALAEAPSSRSDGLAIRVFVHSRALGMHRHLFAHVVGLVVAALGCRLASSSMALDASDAPLLQCDAAVLRPFMSGFVGEHCIFETGFRTGFAMLSSVPTSTQMRAICRSRACKMLFQKAAEQYKGVDCIVPTGNKLRLYTDLVDQVMHRCPDMKDVYTLMDCEPTNENEASANNLSDVSITREFWYYPDSTNISYVPEDASKHTVESKESMSWEGDEVAVHHDGWAIVAYIDEHGARECVGEYAGVMEAGRIVTTAFVCARGDDHVFRMPAPRLQERLSSSRGVQCRRRYVCASEE